MEKIKVMVVDDHPVFREGLCRVLAEQEDIEVVAQAGCADEAINILQDVQPDVATIDISLPKTDGIELAKRLKAILPEVAIIILSAYDYEAYVVSALRAGASGYLLKDTNPRDIANAVRSVHARESVFETRTIDKILRKITAGNEKKETAGQLKRRELDVLKLAAMGKTNRQIADVLNISERTVQAHMMSMFRKLEVHTRTGAILRALHEGWLTIDSIG
jgi:DNA-binding NarL/FixJ family response regulator